MKGEKYVTTHLPRTLHGRGGIKEGKGEGKEKGREWKSGGRVKDGQLPKIILTDYSRKSRSTEGLSDGMC